MRRRLARLLGLARHCQRSAPVAHRRADRLRRRPVLPRLRHARDDDRRSHDQINLMPCAFGPTIAQVAVGSKVTFVNGPDSPIS